MSVEFSDVDRLILERWMEVTGLLDAHRGLQDRLEEQIRIVSDRVERWARPLGFDVTCSPRDSEIYAWRPNWYDKRKEVSRVWLTLGGFCPIGFRKVDAAHPYLWVYTDDLEHFRVKEPERMAFAQALRAALGNAAQDWEAHDVDDSDSPLGRYLLSYDNSQRARLLAEADALFTFCTEHFPTLFTLADVIDNELKKLGR